MIALPKRTAKLFYQRFYLHTMLRQVLDQFEFVLKGRGFRRTLSVVIPSKARDLGFCTRRPRRCLKPTPRSLALLGMTS